MLTGSLSRRNNYGNKLTSVSVVSAINGLITGKRFLKKEGTMSAKEERLAPNLYRLIGTLIAFNQSPLNQKRIGKKD